MSSPAENVQWPSPDIFHDKGLTTLQEIYVTMITLLNMGGRTEHSKVDGKWYAYTASAVVESYETSDDTKTEALRVRETPVVSIRESVDTSTDLDCAPARVFTLEHGMLRDELSDDDRVTLESASEQFEWKSLVLAVIEDGDELGASWGSHPDKTPSAYISLIDAITGKDLTLSQQGQLIELLDAMMQDVGDEVATLQGTETLVDPIQDGTHVPFEHLPVMDYCDKCSGGSQLCIHNLSMN